MIDFFCYVRSEEINSILCSPSQATIPMDELFKPIPKKSTTDENQYSEVHIIVKTKHGNIIKMPVSTWAKVRNPDEYEVLEYI